MSRQIAQSLKVVAVLAVALLAVVWGCWSSKGPSETKTRGLESGPASGGARKIVAGDYRLKLYLATRCCEMSMDEPASLRGPETIEADDSVVVVPATADVRVENKVLARVSAGQVLSVTEVKGDFVGVSMLVAGKPVAGWLRQAGCGVQGIRTQVGVHALGHAALRHAAGGPVGAEGQAL